MPHAASTGKSVNPDAINETATSVVTAQSEKLSKHAALSVSDFTLLFRIKYIIPMTNLTAIEIISTINAGREYSALSPENRLLTDEISSSAPTISTKALTTKAATYSKRP